MRLYKQNDISKKVILYMVDDSDHVSPETGLTLTVRVSKNGGAFAAGAGSVAELEDGLYAYTFGAGDVDTLGPVVIKATATGADQCVVEGRVVAFDPDDASALGLGRLDAAITSRLAAADVPENFKDLSITAIDAIHQRIVGTTEIDFNTNPSTMIITYDGSTSFVYEIFTGADGDEKVTGPDDVITKMVLVTEPS